MDKRRLGALALTSVVAGVTMFSGVADAQENEVITTEVYSANAAATALHVNVLGTDLTLSDARSSIDSKPFAGAYGSEVLTPLFTATDISAEVSKRNGTANGGTAGSCTFDGLEALPGVARVVDATCPSVTASIVDGNPVSTSTGAQFKLDISVKEILETLTLDTIIGGTGEAGTGNDNNDGLDDTVLDSLEPLVTTLTGVPVVGDIVDDTVVTVDNLLEDVLGLDTTVRIVVGPVKTITEATGTLDEGTVSASAIAQAVRIELLSLSTPFENTEYDGLLNDLGVGDPLVTIVISEAKGTHTIARGTGDLVDQAGEAAVLRIKIGGQHLPLVEEQLLPLLDAIGLGNILTSVSTGVQSIPGLEGTEITWADRELVVRGPGEFTLLEGTPLETTIILSSVDLGANGFSGSGVRVHTLKGVQGGVLASLSDITGGGAGETDKTEVLGVVIGDTELARTGATPWIPLAGMVLLGAALSGRRVARREI